MLEKIEALLKPLIKKCYRIGAAQQEFSKEVADQTRFGGLPYAENGSKTPVCETCSQPLSFVFQYRQDPKENVGELSQFFYCFPCTPCGIGDEKGQWKIRNFSTPSREKFDQNAAGEPDTAIKPCITVIDEVNMLPDYETLEDSEHQVIGLCEEVDPDDPWDVYEEACTVMGCETEPFSSIGGYPIWIQGVTSKKCPVCDEEMEFVAQIDSVPEAELMWGDAGCVYLFRCKKHPEKISMEMQCF